MTFNSNTHHAVGAGGSIVSVALYMQDLARKFQIRTNGVSLSTTIGGRATAVPFRPFLKKKAGVDFHTKMELRQPRQP